MKLPDPERGFGVLGVVASVFGLALLLWEEPVLAAASLTVSAACWPAAWFARRGRLHTEEFERWRTDPETRRQWLREMGASDHEIEEAMRDYP